MSDVQIFIGLVSLASGILVARSNETLGETLYRKMLKGNRSFLGRVPSVRHLFSDTAQLSQVVFYFGVFLAVQGVFFLCIPVR